MGVHLISAQQAIEGMDQAPGPHGFHAIVDARTPSEFSLDHLPGALNWPSLQDHERVEVGTMYKQVGPFEASKLGAMRVAANIAKHIEQHLLDKPKHWRPLVYCWRGGKRSGSLALVMGQIGFHVSVIEGGYKAFRAAMLADLVQRVAPLRFRVIAGPTGSGKTRLLQALAKSGAQVLDLEALAHHRSSVLGRVPGQSQPSQKRFDTQVWNQLRQFDPQRVVFVEAESKKVGNVAVPDALMQAMRSSPCIDLQLTTEERVKLLMEDYDFFVRDTALFGQRLVLLTEIQGHAVVQRWLTELQNGECESVVRDLLLRHYDPTYAKSIARNFKAMAQAVQVQLNDRHADSFNAVAQSLIAATA